ncbi:FAD-dependent monooxygenase [Rhizobium sp. FKY42]|uniref:FAD-dependent monooxygenase n=1 Tax=Rhizobium sp. FKY42 TaxID=2562310 RepID=UPI0010BF78C1|nr:FAD-dependent monooxygenase [Rhizobium sp. FKY42]
MRVLISGAGPAGLTLAACLLRQGITPVIVEKAEAIREAGYAVGIHVNGWNVAERLGIIEDLLGNALDLGRSEYRNLRDAPLFQYDYKHFSAAADGKMLAIMRDALVRVLHEHLDGRLTVRFGTQIDAMTEANQCLTVRFSTGETEDFDLVVAADGYRSRVRQLWFGPHEAFLRPLGYRAAAWRLPDGPGMDCSFVGFMDVDRQAGLYRVGDGTAATLFCWRDQETQRIAAEDRQRYLKDIFGNWPGMISATLDQEVDWNDCFFDTIAQVEVPNWSRGRVVLLGDAAHCMTFLSGQGTSTAMAGAYILAQELTAKPLPDALAVYEARLKPLTLTLQAQSQKIGGHYVPRSRLGIVIQSWLIPILMRPPFTRFTVKKMLARALALDGATS